MAQATSIALPYPGQGWVIESAQYTGEVHDRIARIEAVYKLRVLQDGRIEIPLPLQGATITEIALERKSADTYLVPRGDTYVVGVTRKGTYGVRVKCSTMLAQDSQHEGLQLGIPQATFSTLTLTVPRKDVELRPADQLYVERQPTHGRDGVTLTARLGAASQIDLRWSTKPTAPVHVEPVLYGEVNTLVTIEEQLARLMSLLDYRITQGEVREFIVRLPMGMNVLNVRGAGIEDWRVSEATDHKRLTVKLGSAVKDTVYRLIVEGEHPLAEDATQYALAEITMEGVKQERGHVAVARSGSLEVTPGALEGMTRVDVRELPAVFAQTTGEPILLAFRYHQHPYQASVSLTRHKDHAVLSAIAEQGELVTVLSRQGELLTRATYLIKANKTQFLTVALPEGAQLWSCLVDGRSVKPVEGEAGRLRVPLSGSDDGARTVPVELVYFERRPTFNWVGRIRVQGPVLDVPTTMANWLLYTPRQVKFLRTSGNLDRGTAPGTFVEDPFVRVAAAPASISGTSGDDRVQRSLGLFEEDKPAAAKRAAFGNEDRVMERGKVVLQSYERSDAFEAVVGGLQERLQQTGILPLKIQLPKAGSVHRFSRLMTTGEALTLDATYVHLQMPSAVLGLAGLVLLPISGLALVRFRLF